MCLGAQKHTNAHFHARTYQKKSCHPNLNPIYHQTNEIFPWSWRWLVCSLYASSEISEFSPAVFPPCPLLSLPSYTPPSCSSSHHCATLNVLFYLFIYLLGFFFFIWGNKKWSLRYLGLGWGWQLCVWLRTVTEMSSLGLHKCCEERNAAQER